MPFKRMIRGCCFCVPTRIFIPGKAATGPPIGGCMSIAELLSLAAERRARAVSVRELANHLADKETLRSVLLYADVLEREVARLDAQIAAKQPDRMAIDVI